MLRDEREKGVVDAADASAYVNNDAWEGLEPTEQRAPEVWYSAAYEAMRREADLQDRDLVARDKADPQTMSTVSAIIWLIEAV